MHKLYNRKGQHVAFLNLNKRPTLHLSSGELLAEVDHDCIFSTDGRHIGWLIQNQVYDRDGAIILAKHPPTEETAEPPASETWNKGPTQDPAKRETAGQLPTIEDKWAETSGLSFFDQFDDSPSPVAVSGG